MELEVAVVPGGRQMDALAVGDDLALRGVDLPVQIALGIPLGLFFGERVFRELRLFSGVVVRLPAAPATEVLAVEQPGESLGCLLVGRLRPRPTRESQRPPR